MATTITDGVTTVTPTLIEGYSHDRSGRNRIHGVIGTPTVSATLRPAGDRRGAFVAVFDTETEARAADALLATPSTFTIAHTEMPAGDMEFVLDGDLRLAQDDDRLVWLLTVEFQEV